MQTIPSTQGQLLHPVVLRLLEKRGITGEGLHEYFSWDLKALPNLKNLKDLTRAADRIIKAVEQNERIGIYGDYDVDGTTSCALFYHFFKSIDVEVDLIQPSRFVEGYGLHLSSIDLAIEKKIKVLVTVDCGITNNESADYALERGLDLIITDHHKDMREEMPRAFAVVNPNRRDEDEKNPLKVLAGVGVAFCVCLAIKDGLEMKGEVVPSLYPLLPLVSVGTICDLAKLTTTNMKLVRHGLKQMKQSFPGLVATLSAEEKELPFIPSEKLGFYLGPLINSKGRLDHPEMSLNLLTSPDIPTARNCLAHLEISNNERKFIQNEVFQEAKQEVLRHMKSGEHLISIVYRPHWHEGVIGIVASKLVDTFGVPAIVFTNNEEGNLLKASVRSAGELDIFSCLQKCQDLFVKFGGHKAAAGLTLKKENYPLFVERMNQQMKEIPEILRTNQEDYDLEISGIDLTPGLVRGLEKCEPFGMGNERPTFLVRDFTINSYQLMKDVHVKWNFAHPKSKQTWGGVSFGYIGKWNTLHPEELVKRTKNGRENLRLLTQIGINRFNGREFLQLLVQKIDLN